MRKKKATSTLLTDSALSLTDLKTRSMATAAGAPASLTAHGSTIYATRRAQQRFRASERGQS